MRQEATRDPADDGKAPRRLAIARGLSTRLLWLTMLAVMMAEILIFVPSIANFRQEWLRRKIETAAVAALGAQDRPSGPESGTGMAPVLGPAQQATLLRALDADLIAITSGGVSRLLARVDKLAPVDVQVDVARAEPLGMIAGAFGTLLSGGERRMRVFGTVGDGSMTAELVLGDQPLRRAMLIYSRNIFFLSLAIASFAAVLVFAAISLLLIRPIRRMTRSMVRFGDNPADPERIIRPSGRRDEIGTAEAELAAMQGVLAQTLREQRHLADLGLAVSKINHDLRNILASAQIISDHLSDLPDPRVQRFAPMLIRSLDRALVYTQSVLSYGRAVETAPVKRRVRLRRLVDDIYEVLAAGRQSGIAFVNDVPADLEIDVDPEQFYRTITNLCRNAVEALEGEEGEEGEAVVRRVRVEAARTGGDGVLVAVEDTGPGLSQMAREHLFKAFRGSTRAGGTGLGLAIAAEIVEAHGGDIALSRTHAPGARFEIRLPGREAAPGREGAADKAAMGASPAA